MSNQKSLYNVGDLVLTKVLHQTCKTTVFATFLYDSRRRYSCVKSNGEKYSFLEEATVFEDFDYHVVKELIGRKIS